MVSPHLLGQKCYLSHLFQLVAFCLENKADLDAGTVFPRHGLRCCLAAGPLVSQALKGADSLHALECRLLFSPFPAVRH